MYQCMTHFVPVLTSLTFAAAAIFSECTPILFLGFHYYFVFVFGFIHYIKLAR